MSYAAYELWKPSPLVGDPHLSIVVPAFNERERILPTVGAIASHVSSLGFPWALIVSDDRSSDATVSTLHGLGLANLTIIESARNVGKGHAVRTDMLAGRREYLLFDDADNSTPIEQVGDLLAKVKREGFDIAVGSRAVAGAEADHRSALRRLLSVGLRSIVRYGFNICVRDTQRGFKMFTRKAARRLYTTQTIDGFSFDLEILYLAAKMNLRVAEAPVAWVDAPGSNVDPNKEVRRFLRDLAIIRWNDLTGVYGDVPQVGATGSRA